MLHPISTNLFTHQKSVIFNEELHYSSYNHNYYTSEDGVIILEECNDNDVFCYWWVDSGNGNTDYIGTAVGTFGIFDKEYDGNPTRDENGIVKLDTDFC